jgi:hypothetical protein
MTFDSSYVGGAMVFAQESIKRFFDDHGQKTLAEGSGKKGTLIFTGTLGALRCNVCPTYASRISSVEKADDNIG